MPVALQTKNLTKHFGGVWAMDKLSVAFEAGKITGVIGPNGSGKSTLINVLTGLVPLDDGTVIISGVRLNKIKPHETLAYGLTRTFQEIRLFAQLPVLENLEIGGYVVKNKKAVAERIQEVLTLFPDLKHKLRVKAGSLSGGQQQMLAIARGLIPDPKVLFLDEPSLGLAPKLVKLVFEKIKEINERHKTALVVVEYNIKSLLNIAQRLYVLDKGRVTIFGPVAEVWSSDLLARVFLGERV